jgi:hypothetical protein
MRLRPTSEQCADPTYRLMVSAIPVRASAHSGECRTFRFSAEPTFRRAEARRPALMRLRPLQGTTRIARRTIQPESLLAPTTLMEFVVPPTLKHRRIHPRAATRVCSAHRVSHPLGGLRLTGTSSLISCWKRPWDFALQGVSPHRQVRAAHHFPDALLAFSPRILKRPRMWTQGVSTMPSGAGGNLSAPSGLCSDGRSDTVHWTD